MSDDPYSRLYWRFADEFDGVWQDDHTLALYVRLLRLADQSWPSAATLPYGLRRRSLAELTKDIDGEGPLVAMVTSVTYRVRGMDKERQKRAQQASNAARTRWSNAAGNAPSIAAGNAQSMPSQAKPRQAETSTDTARASEQDPVVVYATLTSGWPGPKAVEWIDSLTAEYGAEQTCAAIAEASKEGRSGVIGRAKVILGTKARALSQAEKKRESNRIYDRMVARRLEEYRVTGIWHDEWGERPAA